MRALDRVRSLTLRPRRWFSWDFRVLAGDEDIALIDGHWLRERASFTLGDETFEVRRTSVMRGTFVLERSGEPLAEATKGSALRRAFDVRVGAERYELRAVSIFRREFRLFRGGIPVGVIRPVSAFRREAIAQLPDRMPLPVQLFLLFLVRVLWKRASDAAAGGSG